jgi:hypothetical protein
LINYYARVAQPGQGARLESEFPKGTAGSNEPFSLYEREKPSGKRRNPERL